jgi:hypothetical protein
VFIIVCRERRLGRGDVGDSRGQVAASILSRCSCVRDNCSTFASVA